MMQAVSHLKELYDLFDLLFICLKTGLRLHYQVKLGNFGWMLACEQCLHIDQLIVQSFPLLILNARMIALALPRLEVLEAQG